MALVRGLEDRLTAIFAVNVKPGAIVAEASATVELMGGSHVIWLCLQTSGSKNAV